jgi:hypothetical protein
MSSSVRSPRWIRAMLVLALAALSFAALAPRPAHGAQQATVRLMGTEPIHGSTTPGRREAR